MLDPQAHPPQLDAVREGAGSTVYIDRVPVGLDRFGQAPLCKGTLAGQTSQLSCPLWLSMYPVQPRHPPILIPSMIETHQAHARDLH